MKLSLDGKVALITGASSGFGEHFAGVMARAGAGVVLAARRRERIDALAERLAADGARAHAVALDVTDPASVATGVREAVEAMGALDVLLNNAGVSDAGPALNTTDEAWRLVVDTNLNGCFTVAREAAGHMREGGRGGSIINIASILGFRVAGGVASYAAAKAGLVHLTKALALEWARHAIRVNAIAPGYFETDINREFFATEQGAALVKRIPQRRLGEHGDLDGALLLLASEASAYMTGTTITVDGGHLCSTL